MFNFKKCKVNGVFRYIFTYLSIIDTINGSKPYFQGFIFRVTNIIICRVFFQYKFEHEILKWPEPWANTLFLG